MHLFRFPDCDNLCHELSAIKIEATGEDEDEFDMDICKGHTKLVHAHAERPRHLCYRSQQNICYDTIVQNGGHRNAGIDHPHTLYLEKFRKTQMMDHSQMETEGLYFRTMKTTITYEFAGCVICNENEYQGDLKPFVESADVLDDDPSSGDDKELYEDEDTEIQYNCNENSLTHQRTDRVLFPQEPNSQLGDPGETDCVRNRREDSITKVHETESVYTPENSPVRKNFNHAINSMNGIKRQGRNVQSPAHRARQQPIIWHGQNSDFEDSSDYSTLVRIQGVAIESDDIFAFRQKDRRVRFSTPERY